MTDYNAGSARGTYILDISQPRQAAAELRRLFLGVKQEAAALERSGAGSSTAARGVKQMATEADKALREFEKLERQVRRTADAEVAAARASGDYGRALDLLDRELNAATVGSERYFQIQQRIAQTQKQQAAATAAQAGGIRGRDVLGAVGGAIGGPVGALAGSIANPAALIGVAAGGVASAGQQASAQALEFRRAEQDLRILAGTQGRYNTLLREARQNQILFGGAITDNLDPLQQLIFISNRTGASLEQLNESARLLGATNTKEGIGGAGFAIGEFLSGDTTSIVERFNLPRQAINDLKNAEISTAEKLRLLNELILTQGDVAAVLEQRLKGPEAQFRRIEQAQERISISGGNVINSLLGAGAAAANSTGLLDRGAVAAEAYAAAIERGQSVSQANVAAFQAFTTGVNQAADATGRAGGEWGDLTDATQQQTSALVENISKQQQAAVAAGNQEKIQRDLEIASIRVATGQSTQAAEAARLASVYPELAGQAGALINAQLQVASTVNAANAALREQQALAQAGQTRNLATEGALIGSPGRRGNTLADFDAEIQRRKDLEAAQLRQAAAIETTQQRVTRLRTELNAIPDKDTAKYIDKQTELIQAERTLAQEREAAATKAGATAKKVTDDAARELERQIEQQADAYRRLSRLQEDYNLSRSRDQEDYQRQRRRLLAEGRIFEAQQLTEEFSIGQRRAAEDAAIRQARERGDAGIPNGAAIGTATPAAQSGNVVPIGPVLPVVAQQPTTAPVLRIEFAPIQLIADGRTLAEVVYPPIEERLAADLAVIQVSAPPASASPAAIGGPRP